MANFIEYVRLDNEKINGMQIGNRFIPYLKNYISGLALSGVYTNREIQHIIESGLLSENILLYIEKTPEGFNKLYIGETAYPPYQKVLSSQINGYILAVNKFNIS